MARPSADRKIKKTKVFGIGFHKTATTSLAEALRHLGYRVTGPNWTDNPNIADEVHEMAFALADKFDAFQDNPWPILYEQLDQRFPDSKFVLTIRPTADWIRSMVNHFSEKETPMRQWIYGVGHPKGNEEVYIARYVRHNQDVIEYFKDRPGDLLVLHITAGEGWERLCPFLGMAVPRVPFPCANTASIRLKSRDRENSYFWSTYFRIRRRLRDLIIQSKMPL